MNAVVDDCRRRGDRVGVGRALASFFSERVRELPFFERVDLAELAFLPSKTRIQTLLLVQTSRESVAFEQAETRFRILARAGVTKVVALKFIVMSGGTLDAE